jgi:hypothetical protein
MSATRCIAAVLLVCSCIALAQQSQTLFTLSRTYNSNYVNYDAQLTKAGCLDAKQPVTAYWILTEDKSQREGLNMFERKAYGFNTTADSAGRVVMMLNAVKDRVVRVYLQGDSARAEMLIGGQPSFISRIKIQSNGKFGKPPFMEVFGRVIETGEAAYEKIMSKKD